MRRGVLKLNMINQINHLGKRGKLSSFVDMRSGDVSSGAEQTFIQLQVQLANKLFILACKESCSCYINAWSLGGVFIRKKNLFEPYFIRNVATIIKYLSLVIHHVHILADYKKIAFLNVETLIITKCSDWCGVSKMQYVNLLNKSSIHTWPPCRYTCIYAWV